MVFGKVVFCDEIAIVTTVVVAMLVVIVAVVSHVAMLVIVVAVDVVVVDVVEAVGTTDKFDAQEHVETTRLERHLLMQVTALLGAPVSVNEKSKIN